VIVYCDICCADFVTVKHVLIELDVEGGVALAGTADRDG
jgi:hypothetical protein